METLRTTRTKQTDFIPTTIKKYREWVR